MTTPNTRDIALTDAVDSNDAARSTTKKPPLVPWDQHHWPLSGWYGDQFWSAIFRCSLDRFHRLVTRHNLTHMRIGHVVFVEAQYLCGQLATIASHEDTRRDLLTDPPPTSRPRKKKKPDA